MSDSEYSTGKPDDPRHQVAQLGKQGCILECVVTTKNEDGSTHLSPMGPIVSREIAWLHFRPYQPSTTLKNLQRTGTGVLHLTDDVELIARAALGRLNSLPEFVDTEDGNGLILADACRWYQFKTRGIDLGDPRCDVYAEVVQRGELREFLGFNRARHSLLELAIAATRLEHLPLEQVKSELKRTRVIVEKTGDQEDYKTLKFLAQFLEENWESK